MAEQEEQPRPETEKEIITRIVEDLFEGFRHHWHRTWGDKPIVLGNPRWHPYFWTDKQAATQGIALGANAVSMQPIYFPAPMTISGMTCHLSTASIGKSFRLGLYRDNGRTPVGGALLADSGNIAATPTGPKTFTFTAPWAIAKGVSLWVALATEDAVMSHLICDPTPLILEVGAEVMNGSAYVQAFGAFANPCPASATDPYRRFWGFVRVDSVQPL